MLNGSIFRPFASCTFVLSPWSASSSTQFKTMVIKHLVGAVGKEIQININHSLWLQMAYYLLSTLNTGNKTICYQKKPHVTKSKQIFGCPPGAKFCSLPSKECSLEIQGEGRARGRIQSLGAVSVRENFKMGNLSRRLKEFQYWSGVFSRKGHLRGHLGHPLALDRKVHTTTESLCSLCLNFSENSQGEPLCFLFSS